jgi:hypothetical protein
MVTAVIQVMDRHKLEREMRLLAEERINVIAGENKLLLSQQETAKIFGKSITWVRKMIENGRIPDRSDRSGRSHSAASCAGGFGSRVVRRSSTLPEGNAERPANSQP